MLSDEEFIDYLAFPELKEEYKREKKTVIDAIENRYRQEKDKLIQRKKDGIDEDQTHRMILNACIFPFAQEDSLQKYGYSFLRASPLRELNVTNMDFLLFHPDNVAQVIFGEAKGRVTDSGRVVDELKERIDIINKNSEYIKQKYLKNSDFANEFVIGVGWADGNAMMKSVLRRGGNIKVWSTGIVPGKKQVLMLITPSKDDGPVGKTMLHEDKDFNQKLRSIDTSSDFKSIFVESHSFAKLALLTIIRESSDGTFSFNDFLEIVKKEFDYLDSQEIMNIAQDILDLAVKIKYVEPVSSLEDIEAKRAKYKMLSKKKKADTKEAELKKKWMDFAIQKDMEQEITAQVIKLQERFREKRGARKTILEILDDYSKEDNNSKRISKD